MILLSFVNTTYHFKTCFYFFFHFPLASSAHDPRVHNKVGTGDGENLENVMMATRLSCIWQGGKGNGFSDIHNFVPVVFGWKEDDGLLNLRVTVGSKRMQREEQGQGDESWDTLPLSAGFIPKGRMTYLGKAFLKAGENVWQLGDCEEGNSS